MNDHYADTNNRTVGPMSEEQLHEVFRGGDMTLESCVIAEGGTAWRPYPSCMPQLSPASSPPPLPVLITSPSEFLRPANPLSWTGARTIPVIAIAWVAIALGIMAVTCDAVVDEVKQLDGVNIIPFVTGENKGAPHDMLLLDNGSAKVGINRAMGAAITWLSSKDYPKNMVNSSDPGRLIQQSYYAGNRLDRKSDGQSKSWSPWSWNPIQGGGVSSWARVRDFKRLDTATLYSETIPKLWDMPNEEAAALMRQWTGFEPGMPNVIAVRCELLVKREENDRWGSARPAHQEVPACYFTRNFERVKTYLGNGQWREESQPPGPPWGKIESPRKAVALFNAKGHGVAVFSPAATEKWNFGPHAGGVSDDPSAAPCMHVAPIAMVSLGPKSNYSFRYWLLVGTEKELAASLDALWKKHADEHAELTNPAQSTDSKDQPTKN